jgi:hypothetical protein
VIDRPVVLAVADIAVAVPPAWPTLQNGAVAYATAHVTEQVATFPDVTWPAWSVLPAVIVPVPHELIAGIVP